LYTENFYDVASDGEYFNSQLQAPALSDIWLARYAKRKLRKPGKVMSLDIGCGAGRLVTAFAKVGFTAEGIEPSLKAVDAAQNAGLSVKAMDLDEIRHPLYDVITAMHVLEHTSSPSAFICACEKILLPSGLLIVEVPNYGCNRAVQQKEHWLPLYPAVHMFQFTPHTLRELLTKHGFQVVSYKFLGGGVHAFPEDERYSESDACPTIGRRKWANQLIGVMWQRRHMIYKIPYTKRTIQFVYWHLGGRGEFVRVIGRKI
jgi:SAM-dependent methyltransferase